MLTSFCILSIMLNDLLQGTDAGGFFIIQDSCRYSARRLLWSFIKAALNREEVVHVLSFEVSEDELKNGLKGSPIERLRFHDAYSDPLGWSGRGAFTVDRFCAESVTALVEPSSPGRRAVLVIDSLSWILRHSGPAAVCRAVRQLRNDGSVVIVGLLHRDLHPRGTVGSLCRSAASVVAVDAGPRGAEAKVTKRLKSGKVLQDEEVFSVDDDLTVVGRSEPSRVRPREPEMDPTAHLTFNLRLSDLEREAKEKLALPFVFTKEKKAALLHTGSGRIVYEPDANDDYDQEDPDDDLDV
ncbi:elongator complex protein 5 isoform X2 [Corythoichthys intestinalis]|uniref:elongator complex protein 5 isoform X2 n=1 Tax=Corythoichthys intestinalis TaxID=161448 RepID=UPI0025A5159A|nr:elongator complex protein 5 isoform X2 [Corythoichthys intestinalis]